MRKLAGQLEERDIGQTLSYNNGLSLSTIKGIEFKYDESVVEVHMAHATLELDLSEEVTINMSSELRMLRNIFRVVKDIDEREYSSAAGL